MPRKPKPTKPPVQTTTSTTTSTTTTSTLTTTIHGDLFTTTTYAYTIEEVEDMYFKPKNLLIYYGWLNSFNSAENGWDNEKVAKDFAKYNLIVFGDGVQDPGHGDFANSQVIIPRIKELNADALIFGYVTTNQDYSAFTTKAAQWDDLEVDGIFMDESGYDYGKTREEFNQRVDFIHGQSDANICFANAWNIDHVLGTEEDASFPNSTYNPSLVESNLDENDWYLMESFPINTDAYTGGYEPQADWKVRGEVAVERRNQYFINLAACGIINDDNASGQAIFEFGFVSACMFTLEAFGTSDSNYGASSAKSNFWSRPPTLGIGTILKYPVIIASDIGDVYWRYVEFGNFMLDFTSGAESSSIMRW